MGFDGRLPALYPPPKWPDGGVVVSQSPVIWSVFCSEAPWGRTPGPASCPSLIGGLRGCASWAMSPQTAAVRVSAPPYLTCHPTHSRKRPSATAPQYVDCFTGVKGSLLDGVAVLLWKGSGRTEHQRCGFHEATGLLQQTSYNGP